MATIDQLKKHYDKLTPRERFALHVAAGMKGDKRECKILMDTAPRKSWSVVNTYGLSLGFDYLTSFHMIQQLGTAGTFWFLMHQEETNPKVINTVDGKKYTLAEAIDLAARRFMEDLEAYRAICQEYNVDSKALMEMYPGYEHILAFSEVIIRAWMKENEMELTELEITKDSYRTMIEKYRKDWE